MTARKNTKTASKTDSKVEAATTPAVETAGASVTLEGAQDGASDPVVVTTPETVEGAPVTATGDGEAVSTGSVASAFKLMTFTELPGRGSTTSRATYPFADMTPGLMFFAPFAAKKDEVELPKRLSTAASQAGKAAVSKGRDVKFAVRTIEEDGVKGCGVYCLPLNESEDEAETEGVHTGGEGDGGQAGATV